MANDPFNREIINVRERPLSTDLNSLQTYADRSLRDFARALLATDPLAVVEGFFSESFKVVESSPASMDVDILPGFGFMDNASDVPSSIGSVTGLDDPSSLKPLPLSATETITIDAAPTAGTNRIDIIEVIYDRRVEDPTSRDILNPSTGKFEPNLVNKTLAWYLDGRTGRVVNPNPSTTGIGYKVGTPATAGLEVAPATTAGYVKIAEIHVVGGVTSITDSDITDFRNVFQYNKAAPVISATCGSFATTSTSYVDVTNLSVTIVTTGKTVVVALIPDGDTDGSFLGPQCNSNADPIIGALAILRDGTPIGVHGIEHGPGDSYAGTLSSFVPPGSVSMLDTPAAGSHVYKAQAKHVGATSMQVVNCKLVAYEI